MLHSRHLIAWGSPEPRAPEEIRLHVHCIGLNNHFTQLLGSIEAGKRGPSACPLEITGAISFQSISFLVLPIFVSSTVSNAGSKTASQQLYVAAPRVTFHAEQSPYFIPRVYTRASTLITDRSPNVHPTTLNHLMRCRMRCALRTDFRRATPQRTTTKALFLCHYSWLLSP